MLHRQINAVNNSLIYFLFFGGKCRFRWSSSGLMEGNAQILLVLMIHAFFLQHIVADILVYLVIVEMNQCSDI